jgi:Skp family chaperone for outer membrane proteins
MSTDKLQALHNTVVEILSEPPSPPTFFDEEPYDAAQASEQVAKGSDNLQRAPEIPKESFGKPTSRALGISPKKIQEVRPAVSGTGISLGRWVLRGFAGILLAAGIGVAAIIWLGSPGDATKTSPPQPAPLARTAPTAAALPPELTPLLQSMARDLASMGKEIEQLKAGRELMGRDNANLSEQLRANQEQLTRGVARLSEQLKTSQEQMLLDNANVAEQIKAIQDQLARVISKASKQNAPPRIAAAPSPPTAAVARKPVPAFSSPQATAQPKAEKPKLSSTSRPPAPAR